MAQAITSQPPSVKLPVANAAAPPTLQARDPAVSLIGGDAQADAELLQRLEIPVSPPR